MGKGSRIAIGIAALAVIAVAAYAIYSMGGQNATYSTTTVQGGLPPVPGSGSQVVFSITDPPSVPSGTNALSVAYSSLQAHVNYTNGTSAWVSGSGSGTLNLMQLINVTQVIGSATVPSNSVITAVSMHISSANITINGTTYAVTLPAGSDTLTANVSETTANGTMSALIDFTPSIVSIFTGNSTSSVFVMVPSVKAVVVGNATQNQIGARERLTERERVRLEQARANITESNAILSVSGNTTAFSVTVTNNANRSVRISHIMLSGNLSVLVTPFAMRGRGLDNRPMIPFRGEPLTIGANVGAGANINSSYNYSGNGSRDHSNGSGSLSESGNFPFVDAHGNINISAYIDDGMRHGLQILQTKLNATSNTIMANVIPEGILAKSFRQLTFIVAANGTLALPFSDHEFEGNGYTIAAHASQTFTFNGIISVGSSHITIMPVSGAVYAVYVQGEDGAHSSANVTAT